MSYRSGICAFVVLAISTWSGGSSAEDSFKEPSVKQWILAGLNGKNNFYDPKPDEALSKVPSTDAALSGWVRLKRCRDSGNSLDLSLAAAEHYSFMRFLANKNGDIRYRDLPRWYELFKTVLSWADLEQMIRSNPTTPVSPVDARVTAWGERGVEAGLKDYKARENKEPEAKTNAFITAVGVAYGLYAPYKAPSNAVCQVSIKIP